ncbi:hypothetical protein EDD16DRAFT_1487876 [Pisolithus croceorrhizus]|nr:hypothetical protein EDD16DRAFT_1487876 [Pisolithus croceorrhizus]KAI6112182.1 hypothetical protein EV401DRAFT_1867540 [Pisolithus croceorrhizus]
MAGTQQLPSWMTLSITTITNSEGIPVTTSTTTLQLPLTYYGPSIPLGTDGAWTYGGLYPPSSSPSTASPTATPTPSTATPLPSSSATIFPSSTATPSSSSSLSPSSTPTLSTSSLISSSALIGIIFGAIAGFILLLLLLVCLIRWRGNRRRNGYRPTPIWTHWEIVHPSGPRSTDGDRAAGAGSPRGSGDEVDSFLQRSQSGAGRGQRHTSNIPSLPPGAAPPVIGSTRSGGSSHTSSSAVTDYGVVLPDGGRIGQAYGDSYFPAARASSEMAGHIIPPGELLRIDDEEEPQSPPRMYGVSHGEDSDPLLPQLSPLPPPPPFDSEKHSTRKTPSVIEKDKSLRSLSYPASDMEASEVFTARRVLLRDVGVRSLESAETSAHSHSEASPVAGPSGWRSSFSFGSLQKLRLSWFGGSSHNTSRSSNGRRPDDIESIIGGERPLSSVSAKSAVSGNTVYHDAVSRLGTPVSIPSRAMTPATGGGATLGQTLPLGSPPAYALEDPYSSLGSRGSFPYSQGVDVLDLPVPAPASQFAASGGTNRGTPSRTLRESLSVITGSSDEASVTIDVLDADPPSVGEGWRTMAGAGRSIGRDLGLDTGERRTTFGTVSPLPSECLSEQGSLHSLGSYAGPYSRSSASGSARGSGYSNVQSGSVSSRPSVQSGIQTTSSGSLQSGSLPHRLRGGRGGLPISPAVSAFGLARERSQHSTDNLPSPTARGSAYYSVPSSSDNGGFSRVSVLGPMPSFTARSVLAPTIQSGATTTSDETEVTRTTATAGTTGTGGSGSGAETTTEDTGNFADRLRFGDIDMGRWRV